MEADNNVSNNKTELRKFRKKLREIEHLAELAKNRPLNAEESEKMARKAEYEERIRYFESLIGDAAKDEEEHSPKSTKFVKMPSWAGLKFDVSKFVGHEEPVSSLSGSNEFTGLNLARFVSTSSDTTARVWQFGPKTVEEIDAEQAQKAVFSGHTLTVTCAVIVPDARQLFSADFLTSITVPNGVPNRADEPLGLLVTTSLDCNVSLWCLESGKLLFSLYTYQPITQMALVDVDLVLTGTDNGKLELWNVHEKTAIYSAIFDKNASPIGWIAKANDNGHVVACSRGDLLGVFELTSDPLVGAMINQCFTSDDLKTARGETYFLRKVTAVVAHDSRVYVTTRHRPTIKAIGWDQGGALTVNRFAGRHYENGSFIALQIWSPNAEDAMFLFAVEATRSSLHFAIHVHSLPHKNYALSNFYVGSLVVPYDNGEGIALISSLNLSVGSMNLRKCHEESESNEKANVSPCILCSTGDSFLVLSPSIFPPTVSPRSSQSHNLPSSSPQQPPLPEKVSFSQLELYPKPSNVNLSVPLYGDQSGDDTLSEEKSDHLTTEEEGAVVVSSAKVVPGIKKARLDLAVGPNEDDDNPPTDVEDEDDDYATHVDNVQGGRGRGWANNLKNMCLIL